MDDDIEKELAEALTERARQFSARQDAWERHRRDVAGLSQTSERGSRVFAPGRRSRILPWAAAAAVVAAAAIGVIFSLHVPGQAIGTHPQPSTNGMTTHVQAISAVPLAPCPVVSYGGGPSPSAGTTGRAGSALPLPGNSAARSPVTPPTIATPTSTSRNQNPTVDADAGASPGPEVASMDSAGARSQTTSSFPPDPAWFSTAKSRQLSSAFRAALPAGIAIYANDQPAGLPFAQTGWGEPGSTVVHDTVTASADLRSQYGAGNLVITVSRAFVATPNCLDTGNDQTGVRTTYQDGTIVDQAQGVAGTHTYLTVFVYRRDGTSVRADLFELSNAKVLNLQQLANAASAPGFDISTPPPAADKTAEPPIPTALTFPSGGGQLPGPSPQVTTR